jgi:hypothetical protein
MDITILSKQFTRRNNTAELIVIYEDKIPYDQILQFSKGAAAISVAEAIAKENNMNAGVSHVTVPIKDGDGYKCVYSLTQRIS